MTEENKNKEITHCPFSMAYKFIVIVILAVLLFNDYHFRKELVTRDALIEELSNTQNNLIESFSKNFSNSKPDEKTVAEVLAEVENRTEDQNDEIISRLQKLSSKIKEKDKKFSEIKKRAFALRKQILSQLNNKMDKINEVKPDNEGETTSDLISNKGSELLAKFVKVKNVRKIEGSEEYKLKQEFLNLDKLFNNNGLSEVSGLFIKASELLKNPEYAEFSKEIQDYNAKYGEFQPENEIRKIIRKFQN